MLDHPAQAIGALAHAQPERQFASGNGEVLAAVWVHTPIDAWVPALPQHALALHLGGSTLVEKWSDGRLVGHRSRVGSVTLVPADRPTGWVIGGTARVAHLYVSPLRLREAGGDGSLRDFFSHDDPTLAALTQLVLAQPPDGLLEGLAQDQFNCLLVRHLLLHYRQAGTPPPAGERRVTLAGPTLRRVFDHIETHLDCPDLRLRDLAAVARLSEDHFLRAFRAAVGQTPHRWLVGCRLTRAKQMLARSALPMAEVARRCGFRSASHFSATFRRQERMTPSAWRQIA